MGVSVNKKRACPHLPPLQQNRMAVRPMARPAAIRENTTVEPLCRRTDGARLPRADSLATGKHTRPLQKWAEAEPANRSTAITVGKLPSVGIPPGIANAKEFHPFTGGKRSTTDDVVRSVVQFELLVLDDGVQDDGGVRLVDIGVDEQLLDLCVHVVGDRKSVV